MPPGDGTNEAHDLGMLRGVVTRERSIGIGHMDMRSRLRRSALTVLTSQVLSAKSDRRKDDRNEGARAWARTVFSGLGLFCADHATACVRTRNCEKCAMSDDLSHLCAVSLTL